MITIDENLIVMNSNFVNRTTSAFTVKGIE